MNTTIELSDARPTVDQARGSIHGLKALGSDQGAWLPAPEGPFYLVMRIYWPGLDILNGGWERSAIERA